MKTSQVLTNILIFIVFTLSIGSNACDVGGELTTNKKILMLGEPFQAKLIVWNNRCLKLKTIQNNHYIGEGLYLHKILNISQSKNNSEVSIIDFLGIFTHDPINKNIKIRIGQRIFKTKSIKFNVVKIRKSRHLYFFSLLESKNSERKLIIIFLIVLLGILIWWYKTKKPINVNQKEKYINALDSATEIVDFELLYNQKLNICEYLDHTGDLFEYINLIQYKKVISEAEIEKLIQFKNFVVRSNK